MKLAEALIEMADCQTHLVQLKERIVRNAKVQEGDVPAEDPNVLLSELERVATQLLGLIQKIIRSNAATQSRVFAHVRTSHNLSTLGPPDLVHSEDVEQNDMNTRPTTIACPICSHELPNSGRFADPSLSSFGYGLDFRLIPADCNLSSEIAICPECLYVSRHHDFGELSGPEIPRNVKDMLRSSQYKGIFADSSGDEFLARGWIALGAQLEACGVFTPSDIGAINLRGSWAARELGCLNVEAELLSRSAKCFESALALRLPQDTPDRLIYLLGEISRRRGEHLRGREIVRFLTKKPPYRYPALMLTVLMEEEDSVPYWSLYPPEQMEQASPRFKGIFPSLRSIPPKKTTFSAEETQSLI